MISSLAHLYGLIEPTYRDNFTGIPYPCRGLFIIDPDHILKMMSFHPWSMGRNTSEILRTIDSLQLTQQFNNKVKIIEILLHHEMNSRCLYKALSAHNFLQLCIDACVINCVIILTFLLVIRYNIEKYHFVYLFVGKKPNE